MNYLKEYKEYNEYKEFDKSELRVYFSYLKEKIQTFLNEISDKKFYTEKHNIGDYRIVVYITTGEITEIVDIIQLICNKTYKHIDFTIYKEDSRLPDEINNIISFLFEKLNSIKKPDSDWKYNTSYSISHKDDIRNILNELTKENYELYNSIKKYNI